MSILRLFSFAGYFRLINPSHFGMSPRYHFELFGDLADNDIEKLNSIFERDVLWIHFKNSDRRFLITDSDSAAQVFKVMADEAAAKRMTNREVLKARLTNGGSNVDYFGNLDLWKDWKI